MEEEARMELRRLLTYTVSLYNPNGKNIPCYVYAVQH